MTSPREGGESRLDCSKVRVLARSRVVFRPVRSDSMVADRCGKSVNEAERKLVVPEGACASTKKGKGRGQPLERGE